MLFTSYNLPYLRYRWRSSWMTIVGIALVVLVFALTLMIGAGLRKTLAGTGSDENIIVIRNGSQNEISSGLSRDEMQAVLGLQELARDGDGKPLASIDVVVLASLKKRSDDQRSNVTVRGVGSASYTIRPAVQITAGRFPRPGTNEVIIGRGAVDKFRSTELGAAIRIAGADWPVVGHFDAGSSAFSSEIWGDADIILPAVRRDRYSSITARLSDPAQFEQVKGALENDRRLSVSVKREREFFADQSKLLAGFIEKLGTFVSIIFSLGAMIGAMITMYGAVASRTREIGVLKAVGFRPRAIFIGFLIECLATGLLGGLIGVGAALLCSFAEISTTNFQTFAEVSFGFVMTPAIAAQALLFSLVMGLIGGGLPALQAARLPVLRALRTS